MRTHAYVSAAVTFPRHISLTVDTPSDLTVLNPESSCSGLLSSFNSTTMELLRPISLALKDYKETVGTVAGVVTVGQFFSGAFVCNDIRKQGSTKGIGIAPFLGGLVLSILNLQYGFMLQDSTVINVNFFGLVLNILYLMVYYQYAVSKTKVWLQIGVAGAFSAGIIRYTQIEEADVVLHRFGIILTVLLLLLIGSPLFDLGDIIKNKSTEGMPFPIILSGSVVGFLWLLYGIIIENGFIVFQNVVGLTLCVIQLSLFVIYPSKPKKAKKKPAKKTN